MSRKIPILISNIVYTLATLIFFIVLIIAFSRLSDSDYEYMYKLGLNWNRGPIVSINESGLVCNSDEQSLITNAWQGTTGGCYCSPNLDLFYGPLRVGTCRKKRDSYLFCTSIYAIAPINYSVWKGRHLCGKRISTSYLDLSIATKESSCPTNMRSCGIIDSLNNVICVPTKTECPINQVLVQKSGTIPTDRNYTVIKADGVDILFSKENINKGMILNELIIGDEQPCADPASSNYAAGYVPYLLDPFYYKKNCNNKIGTFVYDDNYKKLDTSTSYNVQKENNLLPVIAQLPLYDAEKLNHDQSLYNRGYIGIDASCMSEVKQEETGKSILLDLNQIGSNISTSLGLSLAAMIMGIILFVFMLAFIFIAGIMQNSNEDDLKVNMVLMIFPMLMEIANFILCLILNNYLKSYSTNHSVLQRQECLDEITFAATNNFYPSVFAAKTIALLGAFLSGVLVLNKVFLVIIYILYRNQETQSLLEPNNTSNLDDIRGNNEILPPSE